jgi:hypothetical protein
MQPMAPKVGSRGNHRRARMSKIATVKVQLPVYPQNGACLMYDFTREWLVHCPVTKDIVTKMDGKLKAYFRATCEDNGDITLLEKTEDEEW